MIRRKIFHGDIDKEFRWAWGAVALISLLLLLTIIAIFFVRAESFQNACESVQQNNAKLVKYLSDAEKKAINHVNQEIEEGKVPVTTIPEIRSSYEPLVENLTPVNC